MTIIPNSLVKYPLKDAQKCIHNYIANARKSGIKDENIIRAYTVKAEDVIDTLQIKSGDGGVLASTYSHFRAYIGQQPEIENLSKYTFKLFLVPVQQDANSGEYIDIIPTEENGEAYVYDFNTPCPNSCDFSSPLYIKYEDA